MLYSLVRILLICAICVDFTISQGYYSPYYAYRRPSTTISTPTTRSPYSANTVKPVTRYSDTASLSNRLQNAYSSNSYGSYQRPNYGSTINSIIADPYDRYRRRPHSVTSASTSIKRATSGNSIYSDPYDRYRRRPGSSTTSTTTLAPPKHRVSKADSENAKFVGANNQESADESGKTFLQAFRRRLRPLSDRCTPYRRRNGRSDAKSTTTTTTNTNEQGRFLWDVNIYNIYNGRPGGGAYSDVQYDCGGGGVGGGGGGGLLGGLLSDPYYDDIPPGAPVSNFLNLFAPGILQNALAATYRPPLAAPPPPPPPPPNGGDLQSDPAVDPNYGRPPPPPPFPPPRPPIYYDSAGASPLTPAQLIGGVATTVNGIIQQLTGGVQPVYPGYG